MPRENWEDQVMTFAPRRRATRGFAALLALVALMLPLAVAGTAFAQSTSTSTITQTDCEQGTIRDESGQPISQERCERLVGKQVALAGTGFEVWPLVAVGAACLAGAAFFGLRRTGAVRPL
jgi:hypothetical protein